MVLEVLAVDDEFVIDSWDNGMSERGLWAES